MSAGMVWSMLVMRIGSKGRLINRRKKIRKLPPCGFLERLIGGGVGVDYCYFTTTGCVGMFGKGMVGGRVATTSLGEPHPRLLPRIW